MNFNAFLLYSMVIVVAMGSATLTACDRNRSSPTPLASSIDIKPADVPTQEPAPSAQPNANSQKLPYGATAPMAPGTDGLKPLTAGVDQAPLNTAPEALLNNQPTAAGNPSAQAASSVPLSATELAFISQASEASLFDVRAAQLAVDRANNSAIKSYAALLLADQRALSGNLQQLASRLGVPRPASLSEPRQKTLDDLARTSTTDFDRAFLAAVGAQEHQDVVELFEKTGRETRDPQVRAFVLAALPTLRAHQNAAERLPL